MAGKQKRQKISPLTVLALGVLVVLLAQLVSLGSRLSDAKGQAQTLREQAQALAMENETLRDEISRASERELIMDIARAELGLVEPGEKVFYDQNY